MSDCIAILNAGSSSIKFAVYGVGPEKPALFRGQIEKIGVAPRLRIVNAEGQSVAENSWPAEGFTHHTGTKVILEAVRGLLKDAHVAAVGHRVVHGGMDYAAPVRVDASVLAALAKFEPLAPLHQPHNLAPIRAIAEAAPQLPQVACFDTAFHRTQQHLAQLFALPRKYADEGIRRYGFHGLSYEYVSGRLRELAPGIASKRIIMAHLGNGASLCALHEGKSVATTMGFTAVDGLMMGTRCGAIDPGVILYLMDTHGLDARGVEDLIYKRSGLLGVSGVSSDMRTLRASPEPAAKEAIALFVYRVVREIGSLAAALGGLDGLVFTGGIGENDADARADIAAQCAWLGLAIDAVQNASKQGRIHASASRVEVWVVPTDEERMMARHTSRLLGFTS
jgi:acetate kinase